MKKLFFIGLLLLIVGLSDGSAQNYRTAIGFRGGLSNGLTVKHFIGGKAAVEGILATRWNSFNITALYEMDYAIADVNGLSWFWGVGGHIGFWDGSTSPWWNDNVTHTVIGVDGILGLEFTIPNAPICFQLDYKPGFNLVGYQGYWGDEFAVSIRFAIK
ncbi:MAG: hypothetical protein OEX02_08525 [Cyclobacteriaceae bacterium]|nr:hypothetical protein [Cyclobacteriaceae bacterium]